MIQGGAPPGGCCIRADAAASFLCPEAEPAGAGRKFALLHIAAKLITLSKKIVIFTYCKYGGENTIKKIRPPQKERKKHKKA